MYISLSDRPGPGDSTAGSEVRNGRRRRIRGPRTVSSTVVTLGIVSLLTDVSSESITAILPIYITGVLGLSTIAFGFIDGLYQGVSALVRVAAGYTSDRSGQPKRVAFTGYALAALARVGLVFASGFAAVAAVVTADRIGKGIRTAPRDALIAAATDRRDLGAAFGVHRALDTVGAVIGPLLAFAILFVVPDGYQVVFVASFAFAIVGVAVLGLLVPNIRTRRAAASHPPAAGTRPRTHVDWSVITRGPLRRVLATAGLLGIVTIGDGFVYLVLQSRDDFAAQWFPLLYVGTNVVFLLLAVPLGRLADRIGRARLFVIGHLGLLAAYALATVPVAGIATTLLCIGFLGAFYAATDGVLAALASAMTPIESRATGLAAVQTVVALSRFVAAAGFGILWFAMGREQAMLLVSLLLVAALALAAVLLRPLLVRSPAPRDDG